MDIMHLQNSRLTRDIILKINVSNFLPFQELSIISQVIDITVQIKKVLRSNLGFWDTLTELEIYHK